MMFYQIFILPQAKRCAVTTYNHGVYELPNEFPNDLRLTIFEIRKNQENLKTPLNDSPAPSPPPNGKLRQF